MCDIKAGVLESDDLLEGAQHKYTSLKHVSLMKEMEATRKEIDRVSVSWRVLRRPSHSYVAMSPVCQNKQLIILIQVCYL